MQIEFLLPWLLLYLPFTIKHFKTIFFTEILMLEVNLRSFFPLEIVKPVKNTLKNTQIFFLVKIFTKCNFLTDGRKNEMFGMHIYMFSPHLLKTYFGFTSKFEKNRENRNFSFKNIMYKTLFFFSQY